MFLFYDFERFFRSGLLRFGKFLKFVNFNRDFMILVKDFLYKN